MKAELSFEAIGTKWKIDIFGLLSKEREREILKIILERIERFDVIYSRFRFDSWVTKLSKQAGKYEIPEDGAVLFSMYEKLYKITDGLMTPLIGQTLSDLGYDAEYSFKQKKEICSPLSWDEVIDLKPLFVNLKKPALLDFGALGKGHLIDVVGRTLEKENIFSYIINAGGDILHKSFKSQSVKIGLEHPEDFTKVIGVFELCNKSIAGSAGNRRKWDGEKEDWNHIINPKTLSSPQNILAIWAVADTAILADAMTTALYFTTPEILQKYFKFEYLIVYTDKSMSGNLLENHMLELH